MIKTEWGICEFLICRGERTIMQRRRLRRYGSLTQLKCLWRRRRRRYMSLDIPVFPSLRQIRIYRR